MENLTAHEDRPARTLPDRIADELIARIFTGELAAGQSLPPERRLAAELGVDRTSLRMALRQLGRMSLLRTLRGSGVTVLDYREHAGLDFLAAVLEVPGLELGGAFLLEALGHWNAAMPHVTARALSRATPADLRRLDGRFAEQLRCLDQGGALAEVVEIELDLQDALVELVGDTTLQLMANSTRGLRRALTRLQFSLVDVRAQVEAQRAQMRAALASERPAEAIARAHGAALAERHERLRRHLASLPPNPRRRGGWERGRAGLSKGKG